MQFDDGWLHPMIVNEKNNGDEPISFILHEKEFNCLCIIIWTIYNFWLLHKCDMHSVWKLMDGNDITSSKWEGFPNEWFEYCLSTVGEIQKPFLKHLQNVVVLFVHPSAQHHCKLSMTKILISHVPFSRGFPISD